MLCRIPQHDTTFVRLDKCFIRVEFSSKRDQEKTIPNSPRNRAIVNFIVFQYCHLSIIQVEYALHVASFPNKMYTYYFDIGLLYKLPPSSILIAFIRQLFRIFRWHACHLNILPILHYSGAPALPVSAITQDRGRTRIKMNYIDHRGDIHLVHRFTSLQKIYERLPVLSFFSIYSILNKSTSMQYNAAINM